MKRLLLLLEYCAIALSIDIEETLFTRLINGALNGTEIERCQIEYVMNVTSNNLQDVVQPRI